MMQAPRCERLLANSSKTNDKRQARRQRASSSGALSNGEPTLSSYLKMDNPFSNSGNNNNNNNRTRNKEPVTVTVYVLVKKQ